MDNSRLKFRVWYNGDYSLTPFCNLDRNGNVWLFYSENDEDMESWDGIDITDKCTLEMSTGLMDKNGNLIYEGDIIKCEIDIERELSVVWDDGCFGVYVPIKDEFVKFYTLGNFTKHEWEVKNIEIIGNIHTQVKE